MDYRRITFQNPFSKRQQTRWVQRVEAGSDDTTIVTYRIVEIGGEWNGQTVVFKDHGAVSKVEATYESGEVRTTLNLLFSHLIGVRGAQMDLKYGELEVAK